MLELATPADLWDFHKAGEWVLVTTNGTVKKNGSAVMGRGCALEAANKFPDLPAKLGSALTVFGNHTYVWPEFKVITFPTKRHWKDGSFVDLIERSSKELADLMESNSIETVYSVPPGTGEGGLEWSEVKPVMEKYLVDKTVIIVDREATI